MAKSKPAKSPVPTKSTKRRADVVAPEADHDPLPKAKAAAKTATKAEAEVPRVPGAISDVEIGHVAGAVRETLARDGEMTVAAIKKAVDAPGDIVMAAVGWLAREEKLDFSMQVRSVKISLR